MSAFPDFNSYCEAACVKLWGAPNHRSGSELRWNGADGYSVRTYSIPKKVWYDHGAKRGGSTLELAAFAMGWPQDRPIRGADFYAVWQGAYERGFYPEPPPEKGGGNKLPIRTIYSYPDELGVLLYQVIRYDTEVREDRFRYRRPDGKGGWIWDIEGVRRVLYRLPELIAGVKAGKLILDCEGENDAEAAVELGYVATTHPGGIGKWRDEYDEFFRGADVVVVADNDKHGKGQADAKVRAEHISRVAKRVRIIMFNGVKDLREWVDAFHSRQELDAIIEQAPDFVPPPPPPPPPPQARPRVKAPGKDDEWLPVMDKINEVLGASTAPEPPTRDTDGLMNYVRKLVLPGMHLFTTANEQDDDAEVLPAPEQWLLRRMGVVEASELIERHINYVGAEGKSVHLHIAFVRHYLRRDDGVLPLAVAISTLPLVLGDGALLAPVGLDHKRHIIFKVPHRLHNILPQREECTKEAVRKAMKYLTDEWLCDVETSYAGKCILIAAALTMIERSLLPERPVFFVTAGKSRGGKTTLLKTLIMAVTGQQAAAAAWTDDENERKKALISYLLAGVAYILWDNIPRGEKITCSHIERSCTAALYSDRRLGVNEIITAAASAIQLFTGNNVGARGDLASRTLELRIDVNRPDPENREFKHPDPVGWTEENRAEILAALYTVLLGNPMLDRPHDEAGGTRFKVWYRLVGSAVEHAAKLAGEHVDFQKLFLVQEAESDEDTNTLLEALLIMDRRWPVAEFLGSNIAKLINREGATGDPNHPNYETLLFEMKHDAAVLRDALYPEGVSANFVATSKGVGKKLAAHVDEPVPHGDDMLTLRARMVDGTNHFRVVRSSASGAQSREKK